MPSFSGDTAVYKVKEEEKGRQLVSIFSPGNARPDLKGIGQVTVTLVANPPSTVVELYYLPAPTEPAHFVTHIFRENVSVGLKFFNREMD